MGCFDWGTVPGRGRDLAVSRPALGMLHSPVQCDQVLMPEVIAPGDCRVTADQCLVVGLKPVEFTYAVPICLYDVITCECHLN